MSQFPKVETLGNYEVKFMKINNRQRSAIRRLWNVAQVANMGDLEEVTLPDAQIEKMSKEEKESYDKKLEQIAGVMVLKSMAHEFYEKVRDVIFDHVIITGQGNALEKLNGFSNCFDDDESLETLIFIKGIDIYMGKSQAGESTGPESTKNLTQL